MPFLSDYFFSELGSDEEVSNASALAMLKKMAKQKKLGAVTKQAI